MTKQQQIAQFLDRRVSWPRMLGPQPWLPYPYTVPAPRPTVDELARELLSDSEYRALQLGTWLNTTNGQIISEAVEMVLPPFYRQDAELLVEALQLAAKLQAQEGQDKAGKIALGALGFAALLSFGIAASSGQAA